MVTVRIDTEEWYPVYKPYEGEREWRCTEAEVDEETLARWKEAFDAFHAVQKELRDIVAPPCPECGHPLYRHQEIKRGAVVEDFRCLDHTFTEEHPHGRPCFCRHGCPPELADIVAENEREIAARLARRAARARARAQDAPHA